MKKIVFTIASVWILGMMIPMRIFAMTAYFESDHAMYGVGDPIVVDVYLDTDEARVNTVEGEIFIETNTLNVLDIADGNSSVLFWIDKPAFDRNTGTILFSGITPGGLSGEKIFLFSIILEGEQIRGTADFSFNFGRVLLHDGEGTSEPFSFIPKKIFISEDPLFENPTPLPTDREAPEDFTPTITQDDNLYDGKFVLVFATQDKGSGIARYEIKEGYLGRYIPAESPYVLKDQKSFKTIFVKAVDEAGNERVAIVHPQEKIIDENFILIFSILIVIIISIIVYRKKRT